MNKIRIIGLVLLLLGLTAHFLLEINGFWIGGFIGLGIGILVTGKVKKVW